MTAAIKNLVKRYRAAVDSGSKDIRFTTQEIGDVVAELAVNGIDAATSIKSILEAIKRIEDNSSKDGGGLDGGKF